MIRTCSVCSLGVKFNIDFSFSEMGRLFKIINVLHVHTQRKNQEELERVHESNFENSKSLFPPR